MNYADVLTDDGQDGLYGVYVGIVSEIKDDQQLGRVKLTFPWRDAKDESNWARIATSMAGNEMGTYFLPEKGDEVLVAFAGGDIHEPYVIGSLWNGKQKPPQQADEKNNVRQIKSRSGHEITFDDTFGKGTVTIKTSAGQTVVLDDENKAISIEDTNQNKVTMDEKGVQVEAKKALTLSGDSIKLKAKQGISISGQKLEAKAQTKAKISGSALVIKAQGKADLQAGGAFNLKSSGMLKMQGSVIMLN